MGIFEIDTLNGDFYGYTTGTSEEDVFDELLNDGNGFNGDTLSVCELCREEIIERIFECNDTELIECAEELPEYRELILTYKYNKAKTEFNMSESYKRRNDLYKYIQRLRKELKQYDKKNN